MGVEGLARRLLDVTRDEAEGDVALEERATLTAEEAAWRRCLAQINAQWWFLDDRRGIAHMGSLPWCLFVLGEGDVREALARGLEQRWLTRRCLVVREVRLAIGPIRWPDRGEEPAFEDGGHACVCGASLPKFKQRCDACRRRKAHERSAAMRRRREVRGCGN